MRHTTAPATGVSRAHFVCPAANLRRRWAGCLSPDVHGILCSVVAPAALARKRPGLLDVVDDDGYSATTYPSPPRLRETRLPSHLLDCRTLSVACFNPNTHILHTLTSILGEVFDVTKGKKHYGKGGSYEFFTGKDASRSFVSGDFSQVGIGWSTTPSVLSFRCVVRMWRRDISRRRGDHRNLARLPGLRKQSGGCVSTWYGRNTAVRRVVCIMCVVLSTLLFSLVASGFFVYYAPNRTSCGCCSPCSFFSAVPLSPVCWSWLIYQQYDFSPRSPDSLVCFLTS